MSTSPARNGNVSTLFVYPNVKPNSSDASTHSVHESPQQAARPHGARSVESHLSVAAGGVPHRCFVRPP